MPGFLDEPSVNLPTTVEQLRRLQEFDETHHEEERSRIAREIHDVLGQHLAALSMDLAWLLPRLHDAPREVHDRLAAMTDLVESMFTTVRELSTDLRTRILDDLGLAAAIEWQASEFERRSGIRTDVDTSGDPGDVERAQATALFRMFQEVLVNAGRHAGAALVTVRLDAEEDHVVLTVHDDGRGITPEEIGDPNALGLLGLRERARLHGGRFRIAAADEGGTMVRVALPRTMPHEGRAA